MAQSYHHPVECFGAVITVDREMALIYPPVGPNLFAVQSAAPDVRLRPSVLGTLPFVAIMICVLALIGLFPHLTAWVPAKF